MTKPSWATVTTVKAPLAEVLAFAAHHLAIGADEVCLCFDDPDDPAAAAVEGLTRVRVLRCSEAHWARHGVGESGALRRPLRHQSRQAQNAIAVYETAEVDWLCHLDIDEFILPQQPVIGMIAAAPVDAVILRVLPWEALYEPALPDDIFTARHFRRALNGRRFQNLRTQTFWPYAGLMKKGALSHSAGKCFFRTGVAGMKPHLHTGYLHGQRMIVPEPVRDLAVLHFHAQNPADWRARLAFRMQDGAYRPHPEFYAWYQTADDAAIDAFYDKVQHVRPEGLEQLRRQNVLIEANLGLRQRVAELAEREGRRWTI